MSTKPADPQTEKSAPESEFDELTGVYGFFRRHQKLLLYTAGLFTLLTFSITGAVQGMVGSLFTESRDVATIVVKGERHSVTPEDYKYGRMLAQNYQQGLPSGVMPIMVRSGEGGDSELSTVFAVLRRVAMIEGIEPSMAEVDRAIETARETASLESVRDLAARRGFGSLAEYRELVAEGMRVGTLIQLQLLSLDTSDAEMVRQLLRNKEKATFRVAVFDEAAREEQMKAESELSTEDLMAWLDEQNVGQKMRMGAFDLPRVKLTLVALRTGEGQFDATEWADGPLKDFVVSEDEMRAIYDQEKEQRFKLDVGEDEEQQFKEFDDEAVQAELTRVVQAEKVMTELNKTLRDEMTSDLEPLATELARTQGELNNARANLNTARTEVKTKTTELEAKQAELAESPDDEDLKKQVADLEAEKAAAEQRVFDAEQAMPAMENAVEAARTAQNDARKQFDLSEKIAPLIKDKSGFEVKQTEKLHTAEDLDDLDELGLDLGKWPRATIATSLRDAGSLSTGPARTSKAVLIYQAVEAEPTPLKAMEELEPLVRDAYRSQKATEEGREKRTAMQDTLLRLAKEKIPEFVTEREGQLEERLATKVEEWETTTKAAIEEAKQMLARPGLGTKPRESWQRTLTQQEQSLARKESQVEMFRRQVQAEIDGEIADEAKKHYAAVLDQAATEVGFEVSAVGPLRRDLSRQPRFEDIYGKTAGYVFLHHGELESGEAVGPVVDTEERRIYVIACTASQDLELADLTRRDFEMIRSNFAWAQYVNGIQQAFTIEALTDRYQLEETRGELEVPEPAKSE